MFVLHKRVAHLRFPSYRLPRYIVGDPYKILRKTQRKIQKNVSAFIRYQFAQVSFL